jgi:hypothetical protein
MKWPMRSAITQIYPQSPKDVNEALDSILDVGFEVRRVDKKTM